MEWWSALSSIEQVFWGISIVFSILFIIQFVISLLGLDFDGDGDVDVDFDTDTDIDGDFSLDGDFTLLSLRSIIAFFTFFGWTGVLVLNAGGGMWAALGFGGLAGIASMTLVGYLIYLFSKLGQEGNIDMNEALFLTGEVYLTIPSGKEEKGKVHLSIQGSLREIDAITGDELPLPTGTSIRVVEVLNDNLLVVEAVERLLP